jgi:polyisoprenoid-binding protein YceI
MASTQTATGTQLLSKGTWNVDTTHSSMQFSVRHMMIARVKGTFTKFEGTVTVPDNPLESTVHVTFDPASIETGDEGRDAHLRQADFLETEKYPTAEFTSTGVRESRDGYVLDGDLTLHGVTNPVSLELEFNGVVSPDPWGLTRAGFSAETEINRKDFGIAFDAPMETGGVMVGDKVKIHLEIEVVKAAES